MHLLDCVQFGHPPTERLDRLPFCGQKGVDKFSHNCWPNYLSPQAQYVGIIVLNALVGRIDVIRESGPDAVDLVCGHAGPDTRTANKDPALRLPAQHTLAQSNGDVGKVDGLVGGGPYIVNAVPGGNQMVENGLLGRETRMVGTDHDVHRPRVPSGALRPLCRRSGKIIDVRKR